jgi:hypothetical protein
MATDNAIAALGALLQHHAPALDADALGAAWVAALPIKGDAVEAVRAHKQLVAMMEVRAGRGVGVARAFKCEAMTARGPAPAGWLQGVLDERAGVASLRRRSVAH